MISQTTALPAKVLSADQYAKGLLWEGLTKAGIDPEIATNALWGSPPIQTDNGIGGRARSNLSQTKAFSASDPSMVLPAPFGPGLAMLKAVTGVTPGNLGREMLQGGTSGWADEAISAVSPTLGGQFKSDVQSFRSEHPAYSLAANAAGQAINPVNRMIANSTVGGGLVRSVVGGAGGGAVSGGLNSAGEAEVGHKTEAAGTGAKWGAIIGGLGGTASRLLKPTNNKIETDQIATELRDALQVSKQNPDAIAAQIGQQQAAAAGRYYDKLDATDAQVKLTDALRRFLARPSAERALNNVRDALSDKGIEIPDVSDPSVKALPWRVLDLVKKEMDTQLRAAQMTERAVSGNTPAVTTASAEFSADAVRGLKNAILGEVGKQLPDYSTARALFEGGASEQNALDMGRRAFLKLKPDQLKKAMLDFSDSETRTALFKVGAIQSLVDRAMKAGQDSKGFIAMGLDRPQIQENLKILAPDKTTQEAVSKVLMTEGVPAKVINALRHVWGLGPMVRAVMSTRDLGPVRAAQQVTGQPEFAAQVQQILRQLQPESVMGQPNPMLPPDPRLPQ